VINVGSTHTANRCSESHNSRGTCISPRLARQSASRIKLSGEEGCRRRMRHPGQCRRQCRTPRRERRGGRRRAMHAPSWPARSRSHRRACRRALGTSLRDHRGPVVYALAAWSGHRLVRLSPEVPAIKRKTLAFACPRSRQPALYHTFRNFVFAIDHMASKRCHFRHSQGDVRRPGPMHLTPMPQSAQLPSCQSQGSCAQLPASLAKFIPVAASRPPASGNCYGSRSGMVTVKPGAPSGCLSSGVGYCDPEGYAAPV
jgi:hypothetical protein